MSLRVAVLCSDDAHHTYLRAVLAARFEVAAVVVEPGAAMERRRWRKRRYADYAAWVYHRWRRRLLGLSTYRRRWFDLGELRPPRAPDLEAPWINDPAVARLLRAAAPDVTVVMGTSILGRETLAAAGPVVLNIHGGYLPDYKGNHCIFFALYDGAHDRIGATIHFVDAGIDSGDIVEVVVPSRDLADNAEALYSRAERMAIHRLIHWLGRLEQEGTLPRQPQPARGRTIRCRDRKPWHDVALWLRRRWGLLRAPRHLPRLPRRARQAAGEPSRPQPAGRGALP